MTLHEQIALSLNWTVKETQSFSLAALRELVRPLSPKLAHKITLALTNLCASTHEGEDQ